MRKIYALAASALMACCSLTASAADEGVTITIDPPTTEKLAEFPETFTISFAGDNIASIAKNALKGNPVKVTTPENIVKQCTAAFDAEAKSITITTHKDIDRSVEGDYTVELVAGGVKYVDAAGTKTNCSAEIFTYTIGAADDGPVQSVDEGITILFDPSLTKELNEFPESFSMTFGGCESIAKNIMVNPPVRVQAPGSDAWVACNGTFSGTTLTITTNTALDRNLKGEYTVELKAGGVKYVDADNNKTNCSLQQFKYNVNGQGGSQEDPDQPVQYDLVIGSYVPNLAKGLDLEMKGIETLQMTVASKSKVTPAEGAMVTITGPSYAQAAPLQFNMSNATTTWLKAMFPNDPVYNGAYTLTIPKGAFGDEAWTADPEKGHANDAISFQFEVTGGKDPSEITIDTSFTYSNINPPLQTMMDYKPGLFDNTIITFAEKVYFDDKAELKVGRMADFSAMGYSDYGTATLERISDTELKVIWNPEIDKKGGYQLTIPQGTFWNQAHEDDPAKGAVNAATNLKWLVAEASVSLTVNSTDPKNGDQISGFAKGSRMTFNTSDNSLVKAVKLSITQYENDNDMAQPVNILTDNVYVCTNTAGEDPFWENTGDDIDFSAGHWYELTYQLLDAATDGNVLADAIIEVEGKDPEPQPVAVNVTSTVPAAFDQLKEFKAGDTVVINTDNNALVASMAISFENLADKVTLIAEHKSTEKNAEGAIAWTYQGETIALSDTKAYGFKYALYSADNEKIAEGQIAPIYGKTDSVESIFAPDGAPAAIFNLQGIRVSDKASELPAGIYIVNGKKVSVSKR